MKPTPRTLAASTVAERDGSSFDPFELPDTLQLGTIADPYPQLAAARQRGAVQVEWPLADDSGADQMSALIFEIVDAAVEREAVVPNQ